jgi:hypothetical protein
MSGANKYTVATRIAMLENFATEIRKEVSAIKLKEGPQGRPGQQGPTGVCVCKNGRDGRDGKDAVGIQGATGRDGAVGPRGERGSRGEKGDSIVGPAGKDGVSLTGPAGPKGDRGDVLVIGDSEAAQAVIALRIKLKEQHAAIIARLVERIEYEKTQDSGTSRHFRMLLEGIKRDIERLR